MYLGAGSFWSIGDAGDLIRNGARTWQLLVFGVICAPVGLYLWNGLGIHFGVGETRGTVDRRAAYVTLALLAAIVIAEIARG